MGEDDPYSWCLTADPSGKYTHEDSWSSGFLDWGSQVERQEHSRFLCGLKCTHLIWLCYPKNAVKCNSQFAQKHSATYRPPSHVKWDYCVPSTIYTIPSGNKTDNGTDSSGEKKTLAKGPTSVFNPMKICIGRSGIVFRINSISIISV